MFDSSSWLPVNNCEMLNEKCGWRRNPGIRIPSCFMDSCPFVSIIFFYHIIYPSGMPRRNLALSTFVVSGAPRMVSGGAILILKGAFGLGPKKQEIRNQKKHN